MKLSLNWIGRYVDISDLDPHKVAQDLTLSTAEIEGVEAWGEELKAVVVGEVVKCEPHPDSDHLSLCQMADGGPELLPVVCGAPNVAAGQKVAFAKAGVTIPGGLKLKKTKIRGAVSLGMNLSEREMGLSESHDGILVLDPAAPLGRPLPEVLPVCDTVLEIDNKSITHRPDLWGHYGFARELAALYGRELKPAVGSMEFPTKGTTVPVSIADQELCARYLGLTLEGVKVEQAPAWMRYLLAAVGQRPISNLVDLTNFILLDLGQPLHAFDLDKLRGPEIKVRNAKAGEKITTLDEQERTLAATDLVITDAAGPVALAGVMGGHESEISGTTTRMFLESANFDAATIRRTSSRLGLRSESSARFEKSLDPTLALTGMQKFVAILGELCPDLVVSGPVVDAGAWTFPGRQVTLRKARVDLKLGLDITTPKIEKILTSLHFKLSSSPTGWEVDVPSFRATKDISCEDDLIEEIGRIFRYGNIPPLAQQGAVAVPWQDPELLLDRKVRRVLAGEGRMQEAYNYTFCNDELLAKLGLAELEYMRVLNPVAENMSRLRRNVLPGLLGSLALNLRNRPAVRLFELGKGYQGDMRDERRQPREVREAAGLLAKRQGDSLLLEAKGIIEHLGWTLDLVDLSFDLCDQTEVPPYIHPVRVFKVLVGETQIGLVGDLHPGTMQALEVEGECSVFTLDLRAILAANSATRQYRPLPQYPPILVDLAVIVDEATRIGQVAEVIRKAGKKAVAGVELFDTFRGESLGAGKKSLAFHVTLQSPDKTLGDKDEKKFLDRARKFLPEIGAVIRG